MKTIAIIGAGPAGLSTAYSVLSKSGDFQVTIFEKESQVGGLSKTFEYEGGRLDIGGHRFYTKNDDVLKMWKDILPYSSTGMLLRDRKSHILWDGKLIEYPIRMNFQTMKTFGLLQGIKVAASYLATAKNSSSIKSLEDFYIHRFGKRLYSMFFEHYTYKVWGIPACQLSPDWGAQRVQGISLYSLIKGNLLKRKNSDKQRSLITEYYYPAYGAGQFWDSLRDRIIENGGIIKCNCDVTRLIHTDNKISGLEYREGTNLRIQNFDYVVSSMPLRDMISIISNSPKCVRSVANRLKYRDMIILGIEFSKQDMGPIFGTASSDSWLYMQDPKISFGRVQILNNWSPYAVVHNNSILLELEFFCNENDSLWTMSDNNLLAQSLSELVQCGLCQQKARIQSYIVKRITKAYPVYTDGYYELDIVKEWIDKITNLRCIGRNGQHKYNNMDHSVEVGIEAARSILNPEYDTRRLWSVNNEQQYLEEKN